MISAKEAIKLSEEGKKEHIKRMDSMALRELDSIYKDIKLSAAKYGGRSLSHRLQFRDKYYAQLIIENLQNLGYEVTLLDNIAISNFITIKW